MGHKKRLFENTHCSRCEDQENSSPLKLLMNMLMIAKHYQD